MTRDGEIPAIFNPKRVRTPSVVVTGDSSTNGPASSSSAVVGVVTGAPGSTAPNGSGTGATGSCGFSNVLTSSNPQITHQDSISSSQQDPNEVIIIPADTPTSAPGSHNAAHHFGGGGGGGGDSSDTQTEQQQANGHGEEPELRFRKLQACKESCCSELARKVSS